MGHNVERKIILHSVEKFSGESKQHLERKQSPYHRVLLPITLAYVGVRFIQILQKVYDAIGVILRHTSSILG